MYNRLCTVTSVLSTSLTHRLVLVMPIVGAVAIMRSVNKVYQSRLVGQGNVEKNEKQNVVRS